MIYIYYITIYYIIIIISYYENSDIFQIILKVKIKVIKCYIYLLDICT